MNSREQLLNNVASLAEALSNKEKLAEYFEVGVDEAITSFIESALDIVIMNSADYGSLLGLEITMSFGSPTIWIDTRNKKVIGTCGNDRFEQHYVDGIGLGDVELLEDIINKFN